MRGKTFSQISNLLCRAPFMHDQKKSLARGSGENKLIESISKPQGAALQECYKDQKSPTLAPSEQCASEGMTEEGMSTVKKDGQKKPNQIKGHGAGRRRRNANSLKRQLMKDLGDIPAEDVKHLKGMDPGKEMGDCIIVNPFPEATMKMHRGASNSASIQNTKYWEGKVPYVMAAIIGKTSYGATAIGIELRYVTVDSGEPITTQLSKEMFSGSPLRLVVGIAETLWDFREGQQLDDSDWSGKMELAMFGNAPMLMGYTTARFIFSRVLVTLAKRIKKMKLNITRGTPYDSTGEPTSAISVVVCKHPLYDTRYVLATVPKGEEGESQQSATVRPNIFAVGGSFPFIAAISCVMTSSAEDDYDDHPDHQKQGESHKDDDHPSITTQDSEAGATSTSTSTIPAKTSATGRDHSGEGQDKRRRDKSHPVFESEYGLSMELLKKISHQCVMNDDTATTSHQQPSEGSSTADKPNDGVQEEAHDGDGDGGEAAGSHATESSTQEEVPVVVPPPPNDLMHETGEPNDQNHKKESSGESCAQ
jgi:hypothetical protein